MAIRIDASGDSLSRTTNLPTITGFTLMGWVRIVTDRNAASSFFQIGADDNECYQVLTDSDGTTLQTWSDPDTGATGTPVNGTNLTAGTWYHLAMTVSGTSGSNFLTYLNGVLNITNTAYSITNSRLWVGNSFATVWLNGRFAALKCWNAVLTATEILAESRQYAPVRTANLHSWHPLMAVAAVHDHGPLGATWTAGGTLTTEEGPGIPWQWDDNDEADAYAVAAAPPATNRRRRLLCAAGR